MIKFTSKNLFNFIIFLMNIVQFVKSYLPGIIKEMEDAKFNIETHSEIFKMLLFVKQAIRYSGILADLFKT